MEVVNTQHGWLSLEQNCKCWNLLNLKGMTAKSLQDSFLVCSSTACYQVKDNSPISLTVLSCPSHWMETTCTAVPLVCSTTTVGSPCLYSKTRLQIPLLDWEQGCGVLILSPSPTDVEAWLFQKAATKSTIIYSKVERWWVVSLNCTFSSLQSKGRISSLIHFDLTPQPSYISHTPPNGCKQPAPKIYEAHQQRGKSVHLQKASLKCTSTQRQ